MGYKIERREGAEVYVSDAGYICIKQESGLGNEDLIHFHPDEIPELIRYLQLALQEVGKGRTE